LKTRTKHPQKTQSVSHLPLFSWRVAVVQPGIRAGLHLPRQYRVRPTIADLIASLAGLGSMIDMLRVILRPAFNRHGARLHGRFAATLDGRQFCISRQPLLDAARVLINEGIDPATPIATRHAGVGFDAMTATVGTAAKWTVREDSTVSPTFVRWKAFSRDDVQSPMRFGERQVRDAVFDAERIHDADRVLA
jgi:hypothetical protein